LCKEPLNKYGWTALHAACYYGGLEIVHYLTQESFGLDIMQKNENGWHCIIFTVMGSSGRSKEDLKIYLDILDFLVNIKVADSLQKDNSSKDALFYA
jgi:hypothetical protein